MIRKHFIIALMAMLSCFAFTARAQVAKVGNTGYATIDEAISAWTNGTTLTLLDDVTLKDVIKLNSTEHHILDLGTYTMTAASGKNAIEIKACGNGKAERTAITINADAANPGGINAGSKCVVYYKYADGGISTEDRPIIKINGGVFTSSASSWGTAGIYTIGTAARKCATLNIAGGTFNCTINGATKSKLIISGGVFNYSVGSTGDNTAIRKITGGKFKSFGWMTNDNKNGKYDKFTIGTDMVKYDVGVYVDKDGYLCIGGPVITELSAQYPAKASNYSKWSSHLMQSSAAEYGLFYEDVDMAIAKHGAANVTVYEHAEVVEELDNNAAVKDFTPELPSEVVTFEVETIDIEATTEATTKVTFNVEPKNASGQKVSNPTAEITFRLPVPAAWSGKANVYHEGTLLGAYTINEESGAKFVEVSSANFSEFAVEAIVPLFAGEGTEASPYIIDSSDKLVALRNSVNGGEAYAGMYFKLTSDITLSGEWTAIGNGSRSSKSYTGNAFKGVFDGGNNTISGLTITSTTAADAAIGLFGVVDGGTVKNLNLTNVNINVPSSNLAGAAIGMMLNKATADNITVSGAIVGNDGVGGIVGRMIINGTIANCTNNASVTTSYGGIGGIVGKPYYDNASNTSDFATITNCVNNGTITAGSYAGGIAGLARANVTGCVNNGEIKGGTQTGGIIGELIAAGTVSGNENKGKVSGTNHVGGIIGDYTQTSAYSYYNVTIANNINRGEIAATGDRAAILGCNNVDGFTEITATGNVSYYFVEGLELFGNPEDMVIDATNKFILPPVAKVNGIEYMTLDEAITAAQNDETIILIADVKLTAQVVIPEGKVLTLDLNGKTVNSVFNGTSTTNHIYALSNKGTLTIQDSKGNGSINSRGIYNYGSLTLNAGAINAIDGNGGYAVNNQSVSTFVMNGGVVAATNEDDHQSSSGGYDATALKVPAGCTATLNGGTINNVCDFTYAIDAAGTLNIPETSAIKVYGTHGAIAVSGGVTTIDAGTFQIPADNYSRSDNVLYVSGGSLVVNGGTFIGDSDTAAGGSCLYDAAGKAVVNGGTFKGSSGGDVWGTTGTTIKGGTFENLTEKQHIAAGYELGADGTVAAKPVASINGTKYTSLSEAVAAAQANETITLIADVELAEVVTIPADKTLNIDLNGKAISMQESIITTAYAFNNLGNLKITDGVGGGSINARGIYNGYGNGGDNVATATITVLGGTFNAKGTNGGAAIFNYGTAKVKGGKFTSIGGYSLNNQAGAIMNITDGVEVTGGIYNNSNAELIVDGGNISNNRSGCHTIYAWNAKVTVNGGSIHNENSGNATIMSAGTSEVTINGGTISIKDGRVPGDGNTWTSCLTDAANTAQIIVKGGTFNGGFRVQAGSSMTINGGSFNDVYGSNYNIYGTVTVTGGTFTDDTAKAFATKYVSDDYKLGEDGKVVYAPVVAKIGETKYETLDAAFAAATEGQTITMLADATPALTSQRAITKAAVIDLGGKTMTLTEDDLYFGTTTFKNGTIVVDPSVKPSTAVFWMFANQTLTFDNVKIVATGVTGTYLIGLEGENSDLNFLNGSEILVENTTALDLDIICVNGTNTCDIKVENSKVNVTNLDGRVFFRGNYTVKDSEVNLAGITKAGFRIEAGQTLSIEGTSMVNIEGEPRDGGIHMTDLSATYTKAETATVNATVNEPKVAKVGDNTYRTLAQAVAAVEDGGTITLIANETFTKNNRTLNTGTWYDGLYYVGDKSFTIDLGGFTIAQDGSVNDYLLNFKNSGSKANTITLKNGTVDAGTAAFCALCTSSSQENQLTINTENLALINNVSNGSTVKLRGGAILNVKEGTVITGKNSYLGIECVASTVNIYDGAKIYMNGTSSYNGCLVGACAAGTVNVYGGYGKGVKGGFIAMTSGGTINIEGGEWIANTDGTVGNNSNLYVLTAQSNKNESGFAGPSIINVTGGTFRGGMDAWVLNNHKDEKAELNISGGNFNANPTKYVEDDYIAVENNGVWNVVRAAAKIGDTKYTTLESAFKAATADCTIEILSDVTVDYAWDARKTGAKFTVPVTINGNGNGKTIKFTNSVNDNNYQAAFRFEADATVKNLIVDMSEVTDSRFRAISSKGNLTVDDCKFIGKDESLNCRAIIFGEGAGANVGNLAISITNSEFINWKRGITDNENAQDVKTVTITGNKLTDAGVGVSAKETVTFTGNTVAGAYVNIKSYTAGNSLNVVATDNTLEENTETAYNVINAGGTINAQEGFNASLVAKIGEATYGSLQVAVNAVKNGEIITLTSDVTENVTLTEKVGLYYTIDGAGKTMNGTITITPLSDTEDNRRITIKNINFVNTAEAGRDFISSVAKNHYPRLTIEGCTFTGSGNDGDVAVRLKSSHSVVIKDCTATGLHSFIQNTSGWNLTIENVTVTGSKSGFALGTVQGVTVKGCEADVQGYGIRLDAQYNNNAVIESNKIKAFIPVVVRKAEVNSNVTVQGTNTMTATNEDGLWMVVGTSEYEENGQMPTAATAQVVVTLNDATLSNEGIYGDHVVLAGKGTEAEPYLIYNIKELVAFRNSVNGGETKYSAPGVWVALAADIDMTGENWVGIGTATAEHGFMGNFDGKTFKFKNLTITNPALDSDGYAYAGLFGVTEGTDKDNQNTIKNLTIENVTITTTGHIASAAIAYPYYTIVDNVKVSGDIKIQGGNYTAGVLAYTRRCVNASNLSIVGNDGSFVKGNQTVGGVISDIQMNGGLTAVYKNFSAEGLTISGTKQVGGISGIIATQTLNGASVKNVALECSDARVGIVAGCLGGTSTISNATYENVTGAATLIGASYDNAKPVAAKIGDTYYASLENALAAKGNGAVELLATYEVAAGETKTLDLNGKTVTMVYNQKATKNHTMISNSGNLTIQSSVEGGKLSYTYAGENLGTTYSANTVTSNPGSVLTVKSGTIENLTFDSGIIAYAIDGLTNGGAGDVTVNIEGGVITSKRQALRIFANSTTNTGALNISGGDFTGRVIVQNASAKANKAALNITGGTFNANEYKSDVLYLGGSQSATIDINATVSGGTFKGEITETNVAGFISGGTFANPVAAQYCAAGFMPNKNTDGTYGVVEAKDVYASINGVTYGSLKAAVAAAKAGETIILLQDVKENVTIGKHLTIDGAGKTITGMITTDGKSLKVTIKNVNFNGNNKGIYYAVKADDDLNLVVENCSVDNYTYGFLYANRLNDKIVVKNVTVENCASYGAYLVSFNSATFENFTVSGAQYGVAVSNAAARKVSFKNVSFDVTGTPLHINETATGNITFNFSGINDMGKAEYYTSQYVKVVAAAQVGTKVCGSLQDAVDAANDGETVKVLGDLNMTTANFVTQVDGYATLVNVAGKAVTIDLNGKKVTVNAAHADLNGKAKSNMLMSVFHADPNGTLTLTDSSAEGTGTVELFANDATVYSLIVSENANDKSNPGKIVVNGGNYIADKVSDSMFFADINEVITVNGGNFHLGNVATGDNGSPWIFNTSGRGSLHINVNGGTYNANIAKQYYRSEVNLGEGLTTTNNGNGTWTVVPAVAAVGEELYGTIQEAFDEVTDGGTVKLIADVTLDTKKYTTQVDNLVVLFNVKGKTVTFDLNGKKIDVNASAANLGGKMLAGVFSADLEGNFIITDSSAEGTGAVKVTVNDAKVYSIFLSENAGDKTKSGKMTVNAGNFTTVGKVANAMIYADTDKVVTINGGTFICDGVSASENTPWFINTLGNNENQVIVNGGTFNVDINHQYRPFEVFVPENLAVKNNGNGTWTIVPAQAYVTEMLGNYVNEPGTKEHKVGYATVAEAIAATNDLGKVVTILAGDYTMDIAANKAGITVQGEVDENGHNLVNITGRVVASTGATVKNLNVKNENKGNYDCALCVDGKDIIIDGVNLSGYNGMRMCYAEGNITIKNSVIEGSSNAVHFDGKAGGVIAFENSTITGWCVYASTIESVTYTNCTLNKGNYHGQRFYNANVNFNECTFGDGFKIELTGKNQNVSFTDADMTMDDVKALMYKESYITSHTIKLNDTQAVYAVSARGKYYNTLQAAIDDMPADGVEYWANLKSNNVLTEGVVVPAGVKVAINLAGYNITGTPSEDKAYAVITNKGTLTITNMSTNNGTVLCDHKLAGSTSYAVNTITNLGTLNIEDGVTIENKSTAQHQIGYAIDNNSTSTDAVVNIYGGKVIASGSLYYDGIRQFCNSETKENSVVVEGGEVSTIWMQNPSDGANKNTKDVKGSIAIYGGKVGVLSLEPSASFEAAVTGGHVGEISYFQTAAGRNLVEFVTGGTFGTEIDEAFLALGYQLTGNAAPYKVEETGERKAMTFVDGEFTEYVNDKDIKVGKLTYIRKNMPTTWTAIYLPFEVPVKVLAEQGFEVAYINGVRRDDTNFDGELDKFAMEVIYIHCQRTVGGNEINIDGRAKTLKANYPYFVRSNDNRKDLKIELDNVTLYAAQDKSYECTTMTEKFEITGNSSSVFIKSSDEALVYGVSGGAWSEQTLGATLKPFRFYMTLTSRDGSEVFVPEAVSQIRILVRGEENFDTTDIESVGSNLNNVDRYYDLQGRRVLNPVKGSVYIVNGKKVIF